VDEAAAVLRVGRSTAYREANAFERSGGRIGIPVIRFGKQFRVPRCRLEDQLGGPITWPLPAPVAVEPRVPKQTATRSSRSNPEAHARTAPRTTALMYDRQVQTTAEPSRQVHTKGLSMERVTVCCLRT
jgi:hypothetical protein